MSGWPAVALPRHIKDPVLLAAIRLLALCCCWSYKIYYWFCYRFWLPRKYGL